MYNRKQHDILIGNPVSDIKSILQSTGQVLKKDFDEYSDRVQSTIGVKKPVIDKPAIIPVKKESAINPLYLIALSTAIGIFLYNRKKR